MFVLFVSLPACLFDCKTTPSNNEAEAHRQVAGLDSFRITRFEVDREIYEHPTLFLEYETNVSLGDYGALQQEVEEIWRKLRAQDIVEQVERVYIIPTKGVGNANTFLLKRTEDGVWRREGGFVDPQ